MAQTISNKYLSIGDTVPNITFTKILNYSQQSASLADFKGKIVILDFWATWCPPCIKGLPKLSELQHRFNDKVIVLPVNLGEFGESEADVVNFLNKRKEINLPSIYDKEQALRGYFPFSGIPHCVVIDENRVIRAVTVSDYVNEEYIVSLLKGEYPSIYFKNDIVDRVHSESIDKVRGAEDSTEYSSHLTRHIPGIFTDENWEGNGSFKMTMFNFSIAQLYARAFQKDSYHFSRVLLESPGMKEKYFVPASSDRQQFDQWIAANTYCYELKVPDFLRDKRFAIMLADLNNYFGMRLGIRGRLETRKVPCYMLMRAASPAIIKQKCSEEKNLLRHITGQIEIIDVSADQLVVGLAAKNRSKPVVNGTGLNFPVTVVIKGGNLSDLQDVNIHLKRIGLALVEVTTDVEMIIL